MRRAVISAIAFAVAAPLFLLGSIPEAHAATSCSGSSCTGLLAANTTCASDAVVEEQTNIVEGGTSTVIGNIQLKYSPSCRATWARVLDDYTGGPPWAEIKSSSSSIPTKSCNGTGVAGTGCNTVMIDDLNLTSVASGGAEGPQIPCKPPTSCGPDDFNSASTSPPF